MSMSTKMYKTLTRISVTETRQLWAQTHQSNTVVQDKVSPECFCSVVINATGTIGNVSADNELAVSEVFEYVSNHAGIE